MNVLYRFWSLWVAGKGPVMRGQHIKTPFGMGKVVSCAVTVDLDECTKLRRKGGPRVNITMPVDKIRTEN
jgi:hypothetical protein